MKREEVGKKSTNQLSEEQQNKEKKGKSCLESEDSKSLVQWKQTKYEMIWRSIFIIVIIFGIIIIEKVIQFQTSPIVQHIEIGRVTDFWVSCLVAIIIMIIRYLIKQFFQDKVLQFLTEKRVRSKEEGLRRADQICKWIFDVFYYTGSTTAAYLILKDQIFFPPYLGGPENGDCLNLFMDYPKVPYVPYLKTFYLIQLGAHLGTFIHQVFFKLNDPKYYEFVLHHGLALFLIIFSYLMNMTFAGVVVLFLHDPCDVLLILGRAYTDYKYRKVWLNVLIAVVAYCVWILFRNIFYPLCIITSCYHFYFTPRSEELNNIVSITIAYQTGMLTVLAIMQFYWTMFLTKGAISMLSKGKDKNGYDS